MASEGLYYDEHTFYFEAGLVTNEQFLAAMDAALKDVESRLKRKFKCEVRSNVIYTKDGKATGVGYAWVSNPEVYRMLMGRNPDNSERIQYLDKPCDSKKEEVDVPIETFTLTSSWADAMDGEIEELANRPSVKLEPLMKLDPIELSKEQQGDNNRTTFAIKLQRAYVLDPEEGYRGNVLYCSAAPHWATADDIKAIFDVYSTSKKPAFPIVKVMKKNNLNILFITFDPLTKDAQFVLHMCKRVPISRTVNGKTETHQMYFGLARER